MDGNRLGLALLCVCATTTNSRLAPYLCIHACPCYYHKLTYRRCNSSCWYMMDATLTLAVRQYSPVQRISHQCSPVKPRKAEYSPVQLGTAQYSPVQLSTAQYTPVQPTIAQYTPVQRNTALYSQVEPSAAHYCTVPSMKPSTFHYSPI